VCGRFEKAEFQRPRKRNKEGVWDEGQKEGNAERMEKKDGVVKGGPERHIVKNQNGKKGAAVTGESRMGGKKGKSMGKERDVPTFIGPQEGRKTLRIKRHYIEGNAVNSKGGKKLGWEDRGGVWSQRRRRHAN